MKLTRRDLLKMTGTGMVITITGLGSSAQAQIGNTFRIVVPYPAGGGTDNMARLLQEKLSEHLGASVVVDNRPGAAALVATRHVKNARPTGDTVLFHNVGIVNYPLANPDAGYDPIEDFEPVGIVANAPAVLQVHNSVPAKTVQELIDYAKSRPDGITAANAGEGSSGHRWTQFFAHRAGIADKVTHVMYRGGGPSGTAVITGEVDMQLTTLNDTTRAQAREGVLRFIGVGSAQPSEALVPGVAPISETVPGVICATWFAFFAPAGTPSDVVRQINDAMRKVHQDEEIRQRFLDSGHEYVYNTPEEMREELKSSDELWRTMFSELGLS